MVEFKVSVIRATLKPQQVIYQALHRCYSALPTDEDIHEIPGEEKSGEVAVRKLLTGDKGHYSCLEHPSISFACDNFPHSVIQQTTRHRIGIAFSVQSFRYTSELLIAASQGIRDVEEVIYLRPVGEYRDRQGGKYYYSPEKRSTDISWCKTALLQYRKEVLEGMPEEQARGKLPFDYRQHFMVSFNARSLMHFLDLRTKKDAQLEIQQLCELITPHFELWTPTIADWYKSNRYGKARLAP